MEIKNLANTGHSKARGVRVPQIKESVWMNSHDEYNMKIPTTSNVYHPFIIDQHYHLFLILVKFILLILVINWK